MDSLYIIIPAYNEAENIGNVIEEWYPVIEHHDGEGRSKLVIMDDGSRDDTLKIVKGYVARLDKLEVITRENSGHGASIWFGYQYAVESGADYIFQTDSDGQTSASEFPGFWSDRHDSDVIIGDRRNRQDGPSRKFVSWGLRTLIGIIFKVRVSDVNTPYRLMSRQALETAFKYIPKEYALTNAALTAVFASMAEGYAGEENRISLSFKPITFKPRQGGKNSINLIKIAGLGFKAIGELRGIKRQLS